MNKVLTPISAMAIIDLQAKCLQQWSTNNENTQLTDFMRLVEDNHHFNYSLWNEEDKARRDDKGFEYVYHAKRKIDGFNQNRNNMMEAMDGWVIANLHPPQENCPFHTETPGMIIDRLSILNLKKFHMHLQTIRKDVTAEHHQTCQNKYQTLSQQLAHLGRLLDVFLHDIENNQRSFRVYRQLKMYNDPNLNPQLYDGDTQG